MTDFEKIASCAADYDWARVRAAAEVRSLVAYEGLILARLALADCLCEAGWQPTKGVARRLAEDRALLQQPWGAIETYSVDV